MINKKSREIAQKSKFAGLKIADRQSLQRKITQMKVSEMQKKREVDELESCTFHPKIIYKEKMVMKAIDNY